MKTQTYVEGFRAAHGVISAQLNGISHEESLVQPTQEGNCMNWMAGHLLMARGRALALLGETPFLSEEEAEPYQMGSKPITPEATCVKLERLVAGLNKTGETLIAKLRKTSNEELSKQLDPEHFPVPVEEPTVGTMLALLMYHEGYHSGQLCLGRRLLGKPSGLEM